jgi:hypothetical protein
MNSFRYQQFENYQRRSLVAVRYTANIVDKEQQDAY